MTDDDDKPDLPQDIPEETRTWLESLDTRGLRTLVAYLEERIESQHTPLEEMIYDRAAGEVRSIENQGGYAHVRMHPPTSDGDGIDYDILSIYHVSREDHVDGEETLHWAYLGDVHSGEVTRCSDCGRTYEDDISTCPHCGGMGFTTDENGGDDDE